jgi:hypothetical protein
MLPVVEKPLICITFHFYQDKMLEPSNLSYQKVKA